MAARRPPGAAGPRPRAERHSRRCPPARAEPIHKKNFIHKTGGGGGGPGAAELLPRGAAGSGPGAAGIFGRFGIIMVLKDFPAGISQSDAAQCFSKNPGFVPDGGAGAAAQGCSSPLGQRRWKCREPGTLRGSCLSENTFGLVAALLCFVWNMLELSLQPGLRNY